jgi:hypothetical protein
LADGDVWVPEGYHASRIQHIPSQQLTNGHGHPSHNPALANVDENYPTEGAFRRQLDEVATSLPSRRASGDVRLDPEYNGTVIRHHAPRRSILSWMGDRNCSGNQAPPPPYPEMPPPPQQQHAVDRPFWAPPPVDRLYEPAAAPLFEGRPYPPAFNDAYQQLPPQFAPQLDSVHQASEPGPSKPKTKKGKNKNNKSRSAHSSRPDTPMSTASFTPATTGNTTPAPPEETLTNGDMTTTKAKAKGKNKVPANPQEQEQQEPVVPNGNGSSNPSALQPQTQPEEQPTITRSQTPVQNGTDDSVMLNGEDIYNASPKRDNKGKGKLFPGWEPAHGNGQA